MRSDSASLEIAIKLAIERRNIELLGAVLALGYAPGRVYEVSPFEDLPGVTPLDHARLLGWNDGLARMSGLH